MMEIRSYRKKYAVHFSDNLDFIDEILGQDNCYLIIDRNIIKNNLIRYDLERIPHYILDATEENKTLTKAEEIIDNLIQLKSKKNTHLVAIGGGIVQDLTCFIASILYRGIEWTLVPTTLLAQTDSCIGSKSSINYKHFKNLVGTFYPPTKIYISPIFLRSLTDKDYRSGLGEIVKIQLMKSESCYRSFAKEIDLLLTRDTPTVLKYIEATLDFKKQLIEEDEFDTGIRNTLNFGHTFGHAIESVTDYYVPHGQAVAIGLMIANKISVKKGLISESYERDISSTLSKIISKEFKQPGLLDVHKIVSSMKMDKKYTGAHNCILLTDCGAKMFKGVDEAVLIAGMEQALKDLESF